MAAELAAFHMALGRLGWSVPTQVKVTRADSQALELAQLIDLTTTIVRSCLQP